MGRLRIPFLIMLCATASAPGCGLHNPKAVRTVYVPAGEPVRLRATIPKAAVWVRDKDGNEVESTMDIPEGWYAIEDVKR